MSRPRRRLLVTGGSGYLGRAVIARAQTAGWSAVGTSLETPGFRHLDVRDPVAVRRLVERLAPDAILHTAYRQDGPDAWAVTVDGAGQVAAAAAAAGIRLVHLSTDVVFDGRLGRPYREDDPPNPVIGYGRAKAEAERLVRAAAPEAAVVRTSLIVGGESPSRHEQVALDVAAGRRRFAFHTDELRCPVAAADLADALLALAGTSFSGILHLAGADAVSRLELAELVTGRRGLPRSRAADGPAPRPLDCRLDCSLAHSLLGLRPRGVRELYGARRSIRQPPEPSGR